MRFNYLCFVIHVFYGRKRERKNKEGKMISFLRSEEKNEEEEEW